MCKCLLHKGRAEPAWLQRQVEPPSFAPACPSDYDTDIKRLGLRLLASMITLPAAEKLPATTRFKGDLLQLQASLKSDDLPIVYVEELLQTALTNEASIWDGAYEVIGKESRRREEGRGRGYASSVDGRKYFLQELPKVEQVFDKDTWTRMTRDLFHSLDRPIFDIRASFNTFLTDNKNQLPLRCAKWAHPVAMVLRQLATEMRLAVELLEFRNWDDGILNDALEGLRYSIYDFLGPIATVLYHYCNEKKDVKYTGRVIIGASDDLSTFGQVGNLCIRCMIDAEIALLNLIFHLGRGRAARDGVETDKETLLRDFQSLKMFKDLITTPVFDQVPTATFTELVVQNQSTLRRRSIITTLDSTNLANRYICTFSVYSCSISTDFLQAELLSDQSRQRSEYPIAARAGIPRCMAIIADQKTGIVTTGATPPVYDADFPWLDIKGKQLHRLRISETFRQAVHLCSDNVAQLVKEGAAKAERKKVEELNNELVDRIYSEYMAATRRASDLSKLDRADNPGPIQEVRNNKLYSRLMSDRRNEGFEAIPGPENTIFCWAIDTSSFVLKRPCLRCQRIYLKWALYGRPNDTAGKRTSLVDLYARDALAYNEKKDTCSYCAETVAAAKMYLLRSGRLSLID